MRILHVISAPAAGGAENYVKDLVCCAGKQGLEWGIVFISDAAEIHCDMSYEKDFLKSLKNNGVSYYFLPRRARKNPIIGIFGMKSIINDFKPDLIHAHLIYGAIYSRISGKKTVYTHHNSVVYHNKLIFKCVMSFLDGFVGISHECTRILRNYLRKDAAIETIYNAVDGSRIKTSLRDEASSGDLKLIAVGAVSEQKNYDLLIDAIAHTRTICNVPFTLRVVGRYSPEGIKHFQEKLFSLKLSETVFFLGNRIDVPDLLSEADLFIMSSAWEGLPIALLEALLTGLPVVVTDVGGCREVVEALDAGFVVQPDDTLALALAISALLLSQELRLLKSSNAKRSRISFSIFECVERHKEFYYKII